MREHVLCNRGACKNLLSHPRWWNTSTRAYYCDECQRRIARYPENALIFEDHAPVSEPTKQETPAPREDDAKFCELLDTFEEAANACGGAARDHDRDFVSWSEFNESVLKESAAREPVIAYVDALRGDLAAARGEANGAYRERNAVVAWAARMAAALGFRVGVTTTAIEGWDAAWHNCVYIDTPSGQASWHFHDDDASLFADLPRASIAWDGHTTPDKYQRLHGSRFAARTPDAQAVSDEMVTAFNRAYTKMEIAEHLEFTHAKGVRAGLTAALAARGGKDA